MFFHSVNKYNMQIQTQRLTSSEDISTDEQKESLGPVGYGSGRQDYR